MLVQPKERTSSSSIPARTDEPGLIGYFIILVGLVLSLIAIPLGMSALLVGGLFIAVFGVTVIAVTDTA